MVRKTSASATADRDELERRVRARCDAGDIAAAAQLAVEFYGPEVYGLLVAVTRSDDAADEVFATLCAELWRDLPGFRWESSLRTWLYVVARHLLTKHRKAGARRGRQVPVSQVAELAAVVRATTARYRQTAVKDRFAELRAQLDEDDRTLLTLRIDRDLSWREVATVMGEPGAAGEAALRKRFERLKERLRELARAAKLIE